MFSLSIVDHVRLDCEHVGQNYTVHARAAERLAGRVFVLRVAITSLLGLATATGIAALIFPTRPDQIAAIAASGLALIGFTLYAVSGLEARVSAHRSFAHRLWLVAERYRSLITEVDEGLVDRAALVHRRDDLIAELHGIYEHGFTVDQIGHESIRLGAVASDQQVVA